MLVIGIPIAGYLSYALIAGTYYTLNHLEQVGALLIPFITNVILLAIYVIVFIIPGINFIKKEKKG